MHDSRCPLSVTVAASRAGSRVPRGVDTCILLPGRRANNSVLESFRGVSKRRVHASHYAS